jgi:anti-sigma regulatory factor (Ser/Thr protein kinase)
VVRRFVIAVYEAEMNVVMYADRGVLTLLLSPQRLEVVVRDEGPGIPDIELAMKEGYSTATEEMRQRGFGAGMGLPNIRKNADAMSIESDVGSGTRLRFSVSVPRPVGQRE